MSKQKLIDILNKREYVNLNDNLYITHGSYNGIDCGFITMNDKITINVVVNNNDIEVIGGNEITSDGWYDISKEEIPSIQKNIIDRVYLELK